MIIPFMTDNWINNHDLKTENEKNYCKQPYNLDKKEIQISKLNSHGQTTLFSTNSNRNSDIGHADHYDFFEAWDTGGGQDIKIGPDGNIYLSSGPNINIYDINGILINQWTDEAHITDINGIDFDSQGYLYAMESTSNQVVKFDSQGNVVLTWGSTGEDDEQFMSTNRIACDSQDNVYVVDYDLNRIQKFDSYGNFIRSLNLPAGSGALAIDSQDFIYVASEYFSKYDPDGNLIKEWRTPLTEDGRLSSPHSLAVDSLDALYLTEMGTPRVQKFDSDGVFITEFGSDGSQGQLYLPLGITISNSGLVYVTDHPEDGGRIQIYTPGSKKLLAEQNMFTFFTTIILPFIASILSIGVLILLNKQLTTIIAKIEDNG